MKSLSPGLNAEIERIVNEADTAIHWGSGLVPVYSTPSMVGLMESAAVQALEGHLPDGQTTVGIHIDVHHLAATPAGMRIRARAELIAVEGRKLTLDIEVWDEVEKVGRALHERFLVDSQKFTAKTLIKSKKT